MDNYMESTRNMSNYTITHGIKYVPIVPNTEVTKTFYFKVKNLGGASINPI